MATREDPLERGRQSFESWAAPRVDARWPGATIQYRDRAMNGNHYWEIDAPGVGVFWVAVAEDVLGDWIQLDEAQERLDSVVWLERLADLPTRALIAKPGQRILGWNPAHDTTIGLIE